MTPLLPLLELCCAVLGVNSLCCCCAVNAHAAMLLLYCCCVCHRHYLYQQTSKWLKGGQSEYPLERIYVWTAGGNLHICWALHTCRTWQAGSIICLACCANHDVVRRSQLPAAVSLLSRTLITGMTFASLDFQPWPLTGSAALVALPLLWLCPAVLLPSVAMQALGMHWVCTMQARAGRMIKSLP